MLGLTVLISLAVQKGGMPGLDHKMLVRDRKARATVLSMFDTYAKCKSYQDQGSYTDGSTKMSFRTRYRRPNRLYFEFTAKANVRDGRFVFWTTGARKKIFRNGVDGPGYWDDSIQTNAWYGDGKQTEIDETLSMVVAGFAGISSGTACHVPAMLFPTEVGILSFSDLGDLKVTGTASVRGWTCDVVESKAHGVRAWIDRKAHLLVQYWTKYEPKDPWDKTEINPTLNTSIPDKDLMFNIPK